MFRPASRLITQRSLASPVSRLRSSRRLLSTAPPAQKSRSWKNSALRWGLAVGGVYYYSTSNAFAEEPIYSVANHPESQDEPGDLRSLDSIAAERQKRNLARLEPRDEQSPIAQNEASIVQDVEEGEHDSSPQTAQEYEDEAGQQGAFNPETGEINWDCPCLGGMAHGPCGEEFKKAFSCFVYSKDEPKGMDCIEHFKTMQGCFREHPDIYGGELDEDEEGQPEESTADVGDAEPGSAPALPPLAAQPQNISPQSSHPEGAPPASTHLEATPTSFSVNSNKERFSASDDAAKERVKKASKQVKEEHPPMDESNELVPKAAHDARSTNSGK